MKKSFFWSLVGFVIMLFSSVYLAACHSNGGGAVAGGATTAVSTFSQGPITERGDGTIFLNNTEFSTANSNITVNGNTGVDADLKAGKIVTARGSADGQTGTASDVNFSNLLTGPISSTSGNIWPGGSNATFTVLGQTISVDSDTLFEPALMSFGSFSTGAVIEVSGLPDDQGIIHATFIESKPTVTAFNIRGIVSNVTNSTFTLTPNINGTPLDVTLGPDATLPADFANGQSANIITIDADSTPSVTAESVTVETPLLPAENDNVFIEGFVTGATGTNGTNTFDLGGMTVDAGLIDVPEVGSRVIVQGTFKDGIIKADVITFAGLAHFTIGAITSVGTVTANGTANNVVINGTTIDTSTANITINAAPATVADLKAGKQVIVETPLISNLSTTITGTDGLATQITGTATNIWIIRNLHGPISATTGTGVASSDASFTVFGQTILIDDKTIFEPTLVSNGTDTGSLASFVTGSVIEVSGEPDGEGNILATFIGSSPTTTEYHVMGLISDVTGTPSLSFTLTPIEGGTELSVSLATGVTVTTGLAQGDFVDVLINPDDFTSPFTSTTITAIAVDVVDLPLRIENDKVNVEGIVSGLTGNTFTVNGIDVNAGSLPGGLPAETANGARVRVRGTIAADGVLVADEVEVI